MTDRVLSVPVHGAATCALLPGREVALQRREMMGASGGLFLPIGRYVMIQYIAERIADAIVDYFDDED